MTGQGSRYDRQRYRQLEAAFPTFGEEAVFIRMAGLRAPQYPLLAHFRAIAAKRMSQDESTETICA